MYRTHWQAGPISLVVLTLAMLVGCGRKDDTPARPSTPPPTSTPTTPTLTPVEHARGAPDKKPPEGPHVKVLMGIENYEKAAAKLATGKTVKLKGPVSLISSKGSVVVMSRSELYEGDQAVIRAEDLTKAFMTDRNAALKKYNLERGDNELVVEGVLIDVEPQDFCVILAGHKP